VTGRSQAGLHSARQELGTDAIVVSSDARSLTDIDALAAQVTTEFDTIDLLFVNAGFSSPTPLANVTEDIYDEMFNLNAKGPFFAVQKLSPLINRGGSVVLTTSVANVRGCAMLPDLVRLAPAPEIQAPTPFASASPRIHVPLWMNCGGSGLHAAEVPRTLCPNHGGEGNRD
jgi:NAD(P)-dependent dehydrogenase (short-subunit alcohol dehydrogenase family)